MGKNSNLHQAKKNKNDEFYTQLTDIEKELVHYVDFFEGKTVYCNCDDARESNFFKYFSNRFEELGLKKLIATGYKENGHGVLLVYEGDKNGNRCVDDEEIKVTELQGDGDFRSDECIEFLKEADVVVTNPPFSLFREYVKQLMDYEKKFLILSNNNAITFKDFFPYIKNNKVWLGRTLFTGKMPFFKVSDDYPLENQRFERREDGLYKQVNSICWFTNIPNDAKREVLSIYKKYHGYESEYPTYDNYNAIECERIANLPIDLAIGSVVGVPITALKYLWSDGYLYFDDGGENSQTYEIEKFRKGNDDKDLSYIRERERESHTVLQNTYQTYQIVGLDRYIAGNHYPNKRMFINNKEIYARIIIKRIK